MFSWFFCYICVPCGEAAPTCVSCIEAVAEATCETCIPCSTCAPCGGVPCGVILSDTHVTTFNVCLPFEHPYWYEMVYNRDFYYSASLGKEPTNWNYIDFWDSFMTIFHTFGSVYIHNFIVYFCYFVVMIFLVIILIAVYKESWWNVKGFKKFLLIIIGAVLLIFVFLLSLRYYLLHVTGDFFNLSPENFGLFGLFYPLRYKHFILSTSILDIQLFILFVFICVLISMYFQAIDDFSINFGTPIVMLFCVLGCCLLVMVRDFFMLYLFLELQSLALYVLVCIRKILMLVVKLV